MKIKTKGLFDKKKTRVLIVLSFLILIVIGVATILVVRINPQALVIDDGGGGYIPPPPTPPPEAPTEYVPPSVETPPTKPTLYEISPNIDNDGEIRLSWSEVNCLHYKIFRSTDGIYYEKIENVVLGTTYTDYIDVNGVYYYKIVAVDIYGDSDPSNAKSVTLDLYDPEVPIPVVNPPPEEPVIDPETIVDEDDEDITENITNYGTIIGIIVIVGVFIGILTYIKYNKQRKRK